MPVKSGIDQKISFDLNTFLGYYKTEDDMKTSEINTVCRGSFELSTNPTFYSQKKDVETEFRMKLFENYQFSKINSTLLDAKASGRTLLVSKKIIHFLPYECNYT